MTGPVRRDHRAVAEPALVASIIRAALGLPAYRNGGAARLPAASMGELRRLVGHNVAIDFFESGLDQVVLAGAVVSSLIADSQPPPPDLRVLGRLHPGDPGPPPPLPGYRLALHRRPVNRDAAIEVLTRPAATRTSWPEAVLAVLAFHGPSSAGEVLERLVGFFAMSELTLDAVRRTVGALVVRWEVVGEVTERGQVRYRLTTPAELDQLGAEHTNGVGTVAS